MKLSKSKYCNGIICKKILWLDNNKPEQKGEIARESILENGNLVGKVARDYFGPKHLDLEFEMGIGNMIEATKKAINENKEIIICEASFEYDNNFCAVDILKKDGNDFYIYEVKSSTKIEDIHIDDAAYQYYVLKNLGLNVKGVYVMHLNNEYYRKGDLDLQKLFTVHDITNIAIAKEDEVKNQIKEINDYLKSKDEPIEKLDIKCHSPHDCPFFQYCSRNLPKPNVFDIHKLTFNKKIKLLDEGYVSFEDLLSNEELDWKSKQQIEFELNDNPPKIDKLAVKSFLQTLYYPLYFLDFETYQEIIPSYDGVNPYRQMPFQYSLHYIEKAGGPLLHKEFLAQADSDPRRAIAEALCKDIPLDACTIAYNKSFECTRIKELAKEFPDLSNHLLNIKDHIVDLMIPFSNRDYYMKDMKGSYSIKYVLPAIFPDDSSLNYHNLELVHNGGEAMSIFASLGTYPKEEQEYIRQRLLKYCELDTYAMVKIWQNLMEVVKENE